MSDCHGLCTAPGLRAAHTAHHDAILGYCVRQLGDHGLAEEITQEVFVRAWRHCPPAKPDQNWLRCWLLAVARNLVIDAARARKRRPPLVRDLPTEPDRAANATDLVETLHTGWTVRDAAAKLPAAQRAALRLVILEDRSYHDASAALGVPVGTVKSRVHYALRELREHTTAAR
jgi:RNA polymerase sigma-70 factor (ECF subfamily)